MNFRVYDIDGKATGTCTWLNNHPLYLDWLSQQQRLLWVRGKPGAGKSMIMKHAIDHAKTTGRRFITFFFHGRGTELQRSLLGLYRSLLHQLLQQMPDLLASFVLIYEKRIKTEGEYDKQWTWQLGSLRSTFTSYLIDAAKSQSIQLYVDALDEAGENAAHTLVSYFDKIIKQCQTDSGLSICFSCRHYPIFNLHNSISIYVEKENHDDIESYLRSKLADLWGTKAGFNELIEKITKAAMGVFQWIVLIVPMLSRQLEQGSGIKGAHRELQEIPSALNNLYAEILDRINIKDRPRTVKLMQWVCFAIRPLSLTELRYAMVVDKDTSHKTLRECQESEEYAESDDDMERKVKSLSGGLLEVKAQANTLGSSAKGEELKLLSVQFIHQSVKDFIMEGYLASPTDMDPSLDNSETLLAKGTSNYHDLAFDS